MAYASYNQPDNSSFLTRTNNIDGVAPVRTKFTLSLWVRYDPADLEDEVSYGLYGVKHPSNDTFIDLAMYHDSAGVVHYELFQVNSPTIDMFEWVESIVDNEWHHVVFRFDSTQATAANRLRIYVDNNLLTQVAEELPALNEEARIFNDNYIVNLGANAYGEEAPIGKFAFVDLVEGLSLDPSSFAFDDDGTWTRRRYSGSYGNYGFSLDGTSLGGDVSGLDHDFTKPGFSNISLDAADLPPYEAVTLSGTIAAVSGLVGSMKRTRSLSGAMNSVSALAASVNVSRRFAGSANAVSTLAGDFNIAGAVDFAGQMTSVSALAGAMVVNQKINGVMPGLSVLTGALKRSVSLSGVMASNSSLIGALASEGGRISSFSVVKPAPIELGGVYG